MRAIRITQANWLNDEVGGDRGTVKSVSDGMAREAVEIWHIAEYAPEWDHPADAVVHLDDSVPEKPVVIDFPADPEPSPEFKEQAETFMDGNDELLAKLRDEIADLTVPSAGESKAVWIDWAVHQGCSPKQAAVLTKVQLMSRYGERL